MTKENPTARTESKIDPAIFGANASFASDAPEKLSPQVGKILNDMGDLYAKIFTRFASMGNEALNVFSPEIIGKTLAKTHQITVKKFMDDPKTWDAQQQAYLKNMEELFKRTVGKLRGEAAEPIIAPKSDDKRFRASEWNDYPVFDYIKQSYLLHARYISDIVESLDAIDPKTKEKIRFYTQSLLNALSPTNFPSTNPEVWKEAIKTQGRNLIEGYKKLLNDNSKAEFLNLPTFTNLNDFKVGENLATTKGKVIFETPVFQLIYYKPTAKKSREIPLLVIPPWINKYYIFDLGEEKSFIKWALNNGLEVFALSWVNPDETYAAYTLSDYVLDGALKAVERVLKVTKREKLNLLAYCTGGVAATLLAGYLAKRSTVNPLNSLTLLASPIDFEKMGDLKVFVCEEQLAHMEKAIGKSGYLPGGAMTRAFSALRSNDLIWSNYVNAYLLNKEPFSMDFLYWNCDSTRVPATMHMQYLRNVFLENGLTRPNGIKINGVGIDLRKIKIPKFAFATKNDHIVPWQSAFALKEFRKSDTKFVLGGAGHVAGIINPESANKYCYWVDSKKNSRVTDPKTWLERAKKIDGSWWGEWKKWISGYSGDLIETNLWRQTPCIEKAPGRYATSTSPKA